MKIVLMNVKWMFICDLYMISHEMNDWEMNGEKCWDFDIEVWEWWDDWIWI